MLGACVVGLLGVHTETYREKRCENSNAYRLIERGYITRDEYENLYDYLYKPYEAMGGNGSAKQVMEHVKKLPIRSSNYKAGENNAP